MTRQEIADRLRTFIRTELIRNDTIRIADDEPLITGGLIDSFSLAYVGVFIEVTFGVFIPDTELTVENMDTIDLMVARIERG